MFELVLADYLLDSPTAEAVERHREATRKDLAAEAEAQARPVQVEGMAPADSSGAMARPIDAELRRADNGT